MKRYFYTCQIKAAFMAKYHGMKFDYERSTGIHNVWEIELPVRHGPKYYLHPDSLHLLEPQVGDLCEAKNCPYGSVAHARLLGSNSGKIIQRNGEAFFAPEQEGA